MAAADPSSGAGMQDLVLRLRAAGSVFAEDEAAILHSAAAGARLERLVERRVAGEPLEQLVGWVQFGPLRLAVGPGVFVPRRRSLLLARAAARVARSQERAVVAELFAGVAPLAAMVAAAVPEAELHAADIDPAALHFARRNLPASAELHVGDGVAALPGRLRGRVTLMAAVPPYVPEGEERLLPREAVVHEPRAALFGGADGLHHVRGLVQAARLWLAPDARVLVELNRAQYAPAARFARKHGYRARARRGSDGQTVVLDLEWSGRDVSRETSPLDGDAAAAPDQQVES